MRRGNGPGWGGPAKGAGKSKAPKAAKFETGNQAAVGYRDMTKVQRLAALDERKWQIAMGLAPLTMPVEMSAINSYEARHLGTPIASVQHSGPDGGPIPTRIEYSWAEPTPEPPSSE